MRFGLKAKFSLNLLIILLVAMFLLDFVIMMVTRQALIRAEADKARIALATLEALAFTEDKQLDGTRNLTGISPQIKAVLQESQIICGRLADKRQRVYQWGRDCPGNVDLALYANRAAARKNPSWSLQGPSGEDSTKGHSIWSWPDPCRPAADRPAPSAWFLIWGRLTPALTEPRK